MNDISISILIAIWVAVSAGVAYYATKRGRSAAKWFFIALFLSPLLAIALLPLLRKEPDLPPSI